MRPIMNSKVSSWKNEYQHSGSCKVPAPQRKCSTEPHQFQPHTHLQTALTQCLHPLFSHSIEKLPSEWCMGENRYADVIFHLIHSLSSLQCWLLAGLTGLGILSCCKMRFQASIFLTVESKSTWCIPSPLDRAFWGEHYWSSTVI